MTALEGWFLDYVGIIFMRTMPILMLSVDWYLVTIRW